MAKVDLYDFSDLLSCAVKEGYGWNEAHDILVKDEVPPMYERKTTDYYQKESTEDNNVYGFSSDTLKILQAFFEQEGITGFVLT